MGGWIRRYLSLSFRSKTGFGSPVTGHDPSSRGRSPTMRRRGPTRTRNVEKRFSPFSFPFSLFFVLIIIISPFVSLLSFLRVPLIFFSFSFFTTNREIESRKKKKMKRSIVLSCLFLSFTSFFCFFLSSSLFLFVYTRLKNKRARA